MCVISPRYPALAIIAKNAKFSAPSCAIFVFRARDSAALSSCYLAREVNTVCLDVLLGIGMSSHNRKVVFIVALTVCEYVPQSKSPDQIQILPNVSVHVNGEIGFVVLNLHA